MPCWTVLVRLVGYPHTQVAARSTHTDPSRTSLPPIHWIVPILAGVPYGIGVAQIMAGLVQYIIDTYGIYCASAIASTVVMRSVLAAVFPLISPSMYKNLGVHWAPSVFAFLALACTPLPWLFFVRDKYSRTTYLCANCSVQFAEIWSVDPKQI